MLLLLLCYCLVKQNLLIDLGWTLLWNMSTVETCWIVFLEISLLLNLLFCPYFYIFFQYMFFVIYDFSLRCFQHLFDIKTFLSCFYSLLFLFPCCNHLHWLLLLIDWLISWLIDWIVDRLIDSPIDRSIDWWIDSLIHWLIVENGKTPILVFNELAYLIFRRKFPLNLGLLGLFVSIVLFHFAIQPFSIYSAILICNIVLLNQLQGFILQFSKVAKSI